MSSPSRCTGHIYIDQFGASLSHLSCFDFAATIEPDLTPVNRQGRSDFSDPLNGLFVAGPTDELGSDPRPALHQVLLGETDQRPESADGGRGAAAGEERAEEVGGCARTRSHSLTLAH